MRDMLHSLRLRPIYKRKPSTVLLSTNACYLKHAYRTPQNKQGRDATFLFYYLQPQHHLFNFRAYAYNAQPFIEDVATEIPIVVTYDSVDPAGGNSIRQFLAGPRILAHEFGHAMGLYHTFQVRTSPKRILKQCSSVAWQIFFC